MRRILIAGLASLLLAACRSEGGSCPNRPDCTRGKLCGCACIDRSKTCTKAIEDLSFDLAEGLISEEELEQIVEGD